MNASAQNPTPKTANAAVSSNSAVLELNRRKFEANHFFITSFVKEYYNRFKVMPSVSVIAEQLSLSRQTVYKHFAHIGSMNNKITAEYALLVPDIINMLYKESMKGNMKAAKLFLEVINNSAQNNPYKSFTRPDTESEELMGRSERYTHPMVGQNILAPESPAYAFETIMELERMEDAIEQYNNDQSKESQTLNSTNKDPIIDHKNIKYKPCPVPPKDSKNVNTIVNHNDQLYNAPPIAPSNTNANKNVNPMEKHTKQEPSPPIKMPPKDGESINTMVNHNDQLYNAPPIAEANTSTNKKNVNPTLEDTQQVQHYTIKISTPDFNTKPIRLDPAPKDEG